MSHFAVLVIGSNPEALLAPYQENNMGDCPAEYLKFKAYPKDSDEGRWFDSEGQARTELGEQYDEENAFAENPNKKWDLWELGGRWSNFLLLKNGLKANAAQVQDIDFEGMRSAAELEEAKRYDDIHKIIAGRPIPEWKEVLERHGKENFDAARAEYRANPVVIDLDNSRLLSFREEPKEFDIPREDYLKQARNEATLTFAVIKDGVWYERGSMGWWGFVADEKDKDTWAEQVNALLDGLPDNEILSVIDCHI